MTIIGPVITPIMRRARHAKDLLVFVFSNGENRTPYGTLIAIRRQDQCQTKVENIRINRIRINARVPIIHRLMASPTMATMLLRSRINAVPIHTIMQTTSSTQGAPFTSTIHRFNFRHIMKAMPYIRINTGPVLIRFTNRGVCCTARNVQAMRCKYQTARCLRPINRRHLMNVNGQVSRSTNVL